MVLHRRAGKSFVCIQDLVVKALTHKRPGPALRYAYVAPTRDQARDISWKYLTDFTQEIPGVEINKADLKITFSNGASIRLYSGEAFDRMRGLYLDGVIMDEAAEIDPTAWDAVIRPCLTDYGGWASFIGTPRGRNSFYRIYQHALAHPEEWFTLTLQASKSGIIPEVELTDIRRSTPEYIYRQEYECDFTIGMPGAIYAQEVAKAISEGRVTNEVEHRQGFPVYTSWDIGAPINTKVWFFQLIGDRINYLDYASGGYDVRTAGDWGGVLRSKPYQYGAHFLPHDAEVNWLDSFREAGVENCVIVPQRTPDVWGPINDVLSAFSRMRFHADACKQGLDALESYHSKEERDAATIRDVPVHDWASHGADALSIGHQAMRAGLVRDRSAIPRRPKLHGAPTVHAGFRGDFTPRQSARVMR